MLDEKVNHLVNNVGFDAAFNYNKHPICEKLAELCSSRINIYFENIGSETLRAVLMLMNMHECIPVCGMISQYDGVGYGVKNLLLAILKQIMLQDFLVSNFYADHHKTFLKWTFEHGLDGIFVYEQCGEIKNRDETAESSKWLN
ncbi:hypothetical protein HK100_003900, partial [Physocladia obscura]